MKIGILTFHMAHNFGAMLQAYALSTAITKMSNCTCQIIDYRLPEIYQKYEDMLKEEKVAIKRLKFEEFMKNKLPLSSRVIDLRMAENYDLYILGSDQIWNPNITGGYKDEYFGKLFPLSVSYGASTGVDIGNWDYLAQKLDKISKIGVRETWCAENLSNYIDKEITYCLDPVFLIEKADWNKLRSAINHDKYILIYSFDVLEKEYQEIEGRAKEKNWKIVEIVTHERKRRNGIIYDLECGPQQFLNYAYEAEFIYTDSYHGVLFSIIFEKKFIYFSRGEKNSARVCDILKQLKLHKNKEGYYVMNSQNKNILRKYKQASLDFLRKAILEVR